jgi:hypothetical protein
MRIWFFTSGGRSAVIVGSRLDVPGAIYVQEQQALVGAVKMHRENSLKGEVERGNNARIQIT